MKITALLLFSSLALSACVSTTTPTSGDKPRTTTAGASSNVSRGRLSVQTSDIQVYAAVASPTSSRTSVIGPVMFSPRSSTSTEATFPVSVVYALNDNPRTQRIREEGAVVFVEALPLLKTHIVLPNGKKDTHEISAKVEVNRYGCGLKTRMVALAPANNYRIAYVVDMVIPIRTNNVAGYRDRTITQIESGGRVYQASLRSIKSQFRSACYVQRTYSYFK